MSSAKIKIVSRFKWQAQKRADFLNLTRSQWEWVPFKDDLMHTKKPDPNWYWVDELKHIPEEIWRDLKLKSNAP